MSDFDRLVDAINTYVEERGNLGLIPNNLITIVIGMFPETFPPSMEQNLVSFKKNVLGDLDEYSADSWSEDFEEKVIKYTVKMVNLRRIKTSLENDDNEQGNITVFTVYHACDLRKTICLGIYSAYKIHQFVKKARSIVSRHKENQTPLYCTNVDFFTKVLDNESHRDCAVDLWALIHLGGYSSIIKTKRIDYQSLLQTLPNVIRAFESSKLFCCDDKAMNLIKPAPTELDTNLELWHDHYVLCGQKMTMSEFLVEKNLVELDEWYDALQYSMNMDLINLYTNYWYNNYKFVDSNLTMESFKTMTGLVDIGSWTQIRGNDLGFKLESFRSKH